MSIRNSAGAINHVAFDHLGSVGALGDVNGNYVANSLSRFDPYGNFRTEPTGTNPSSTNMGFTGHRHNNTGANNLGLIYMNARYYVPEVGRFASPDTIVPDPSNPQSYNRYTYVLNSPVNLTDPSGHCFDPTTAPVCLAITVSSGPAAPIVLAGALTVSAVVIGVADLASPTFNPLANTANALSELGQQVSEQISYQLSKSSGKPLTDDEKKQIGKIDQIPEWLAKHPDLAEEAEIVAEGGTLPKGKDHVDEAQKRIASLEKAIAHLEGVRRSRDAEAQSQIDSALERARDYRQQLLDILGGTTNQGGGLQ